MVERHLPESLILSGSYLLARTDELGMQAQGAMWVYDYQLEDWRYYLVTSLVDTLGRRKTYKLLLDVFDKIGQSEEMVVDDVHLGSPTDPFFHAISGAIGVTDGIIRVDNCTFNGARFDGVIYRTVRQIPTKGQAERIEKRFSKRVRDFVATH